MIIFINDTTVNPPKSEQFKTFLEAVKYLEGMSKRAYGQTRKERMYLLEQLGHGPDDYDSISFVRSMASAFEMGIIRNDVGNLRKMKCDITSISLYQKEEYGS